MIARQHSESDLPAIVTTSWRCSSSLWLTAAEQPKWQAEWQKTIEAAKKEGQLSLYGGQEITHPDIIAAIQQRVSFHQG